MRENPRNDAGEWLVDRLNYVDMLFAAFAALGIVVMAVVLFRMLKAPAAQREGKALVNENTQATRENNALLKELIAVNRQLLDKQNQGNS
jgi:hypothetical protein